VDILHPVPGLISPWLRIFSSSWWTYRISYFDTAWTGDIMASNQWPPTNRKLLTGTTLKAPCFRFFNLIVFACCLIIIIASLFFFKYLGGMACTCLGIVFYEASAKKNWITSVCAVQDWAKNRVQSWLINGYARDQMHPMREKQKALSWEFWQSRGCLMFSLQSLSLEQIQEVGSSVINENLKNIVIHVPLHAYWWSKETSPWIDAFGPIHLLAS